MELVHAETNRSSHLEGHAALVEKMAIDCSFVSRSYSELSAVRHHTDAVDNVGLWPSEARLILRYFEPNHRLLDIGAGAGRTTIGLEALGYSRIVALDLAVAMITAARRRERPCSRRLVAADARHLPFSSHSFQNALFSFNGLMQIPRTAHRLATLREIRRVIVPGGYFIFTTDERTAHDFWDQQRSLWSSGDQDRRLTEFGDVILRNDVFSETFLHFPSREEVERCIASSGWHLVECIDREDVCPEPDQVARFAGHCLFWILQNAQPCADGRREAAAPTPGTRP